MERLCPVGELLCIYRVKSSAASSHGVIGFAAACVVYFEAMGELVNTVIESIVKIRGAAHIRYVTLWLRIL